MNDLLKIAGVGLLAFLGFKFYQNRQAKNETEETAEGQTTASQETVESAEQQEEGESVAQNTETTSSANGWDSNAL